MNRQEEQLTLWEYIYPKKNINKPIRLIELFAGIGAQAKALEILGVPFEHYKICEWAYNSFCGYNAIHIKDFKDYSQGMSKEELVEKVKGVSLNYNEPLTFEQLRKKNIDWLRNAYNNIIATHNLVNIMDIHGKDLEIVDTDKYEYIVSYSFPCQDLSNAGKGAGMSVSQKDGGTRSGLLWEVERLLDELENKPQILVMENVPEVVGVKNINDFKKWEQQLRKFGYSNYVEILNGKNYGIPQNRKRCFMVSILGDYAYDFPCKMPLKYKLKDLLEKEVDEKYYLDEETISRISQWKSQQQPLDNAIDIERERERERVSPTLTARGAGEEHSGMILIKGDFPNKVGNYGNGHHAKDVYDPNSIAPTITTGNHGLGQAIIDKKSGGGLLIKNATKQGYLEANVGDGIDISTRMQTHRGTVQKESCQTLTCQGGENVGVVVKKNE